MGQYFRSRPRLGPSALLVVGLGRGPLLPRRPVRGRLRMADHPRDRRGLRRPALHRGHFHAALRDAHPCLAAGRQQVPAGHCAPQPQYGHPRRFIDLRPARHGAGAGRLLDCRFANLPRFSPRPGQCRRRARRERRQLARVTRWTAILLAGSRPGRDRFAARYGAELKALIPIAGEPMVLRPLRALLDSRSVAAVRIMTQDPEKLAPVLPDRQGWSVEPSGGTIAETIERICAEQHVRWPLLVTTADHALLDAAMIDQFCGEAEGADLAIGVV